MATTTYLQRTVSSTGSRKKATFSAWIKRSKLGEQWFLNAGGNYSTGYNFKIGFDSTDGIFIINSSGSTNLRYQTTRQLRDTSFWYHIVVALDTTNSTSADRVKIYVNGTRETSFATATAPSVNLDLEMNQSTSSKNLMAIGTRYNTGDLFDGSMSHVHWCDGAALAPTVFGSTDSTTGEWKINTAPSFTPGTNGFTVLKDGNTITDQSANSNNFTLGAGTLTKTEDNPSNVFATLNPNDVMKQSSGILKPTYSNGNLTMANSANDNRQAFGTISPETGKWYWEMKIDAAATTGHRIGVFFGNNKTHSGSYYYGADAFYIHQNGEIYYNGSSVAYCASYTAGDIISVALDVTNGNIYISKNGGASDSTWSDGSGNNNQAFPGTSINGKLSASWISGPVTPFFDVYGNGNKQSINFGNGSFGTTAVASAGTNASGNGIFEYDVPTGYTALSTKGLNL